MTQHNFDIPDELWKDFLETIEGKYKSASEAIRDFMRRFIEETRRLSGA